VRGRGFDTRYWFRSREWLRVVLGSDVFIGAGSRKMFPNGGGLCLMPWPTRLSVCLRVNERPITKMTFGEYFGHNVFYVRHYAASRGANQNLRCQESIRLEKGAYTQIRVGRRVPS
jgi:hypothetical protein